MRICADTRNQGMSAERALLIRTSVNPENGRYFAVGMDVPSVRVFDTATGELCSLVEPDKRKFSNATVLRSSGGLTGTAFAVSLSCIEMREGRSAKTKDDVVLAAGLSNGTVLLHNVTRDVTIGQVVVSDSQQSILSVAVSDGVCLVLTKGGRLYIVDLDTAAVCCGPFDCPKTATSVTIAQDAPSGSSHRRLNTPRMIFVGGPTSSVYRLLHTVGSQPFALEVVLTFATQATPVNYSWISADATTAVTCGAQEGVVRVWDLVLEGSRPSAVCKRTLPAGHRVGHLRVLQTEDTAVIAATTFLGQVLLWDMGHTLAPRVMDPLPLEPSALCVSTSAPGKLLLGDLNRTTKQLITVRGRFAVPRFESRNLSTVFEEAAASASKTCALPLLSHGKQADSSASAAAFAVDLDNEWASHHAVATRALVTAAEDFSAPRTFHADSVAELPTASSLPLEAQQQRQGKRGSSAPGIGVALGSITLPLYQALHASDESLVMELMSVSSRSDSEVANCIASLQLPYVLHLLKILSKRVQASTARSPVFQWISAIIQLRGAEMYAAQHERPSPPADGDQPQAFVAPLLAQYRSMTAQYDKLAMAYGRLSIFRAVNPVDDRHGNKKRNIIRTDNAVADGIVFPKVFKLMDRDESRGGPKVVRMRSKLERQAIAARRKRGAKKARHEDDAADDLDDAMEEAELSDDMSLNSEEMDAMLMDGELTLDKPKRKGGDNASNLIADDGDSDVDEGADRDKDFDDLSDDVVDSDEESAGSASEVDSSPFEEEEDAEGSDDLAGDGDAEEGEEDEEDQQSGDDNEDANYSLHARSSPSERRLRTD